MILGSFFANSSFYYEKSMNSSYSFINSMLATSDITIKSYSSAPNVNLMKK